MTRRTGQWLMGLVVLGLVLRVVAWGFKGGFHYPDEIFQQLEPAHYLRTGIGWLPWEFDRGLRPWIMPWIYTGLMEALSWVGVVGHQALRAVNLHNALWTAAMIPAGFRIGRALGHGAPGDEHGERAGLLTAALTAAWPILLYFSPHALMGTPSMVCLSFGYANWLETRLGGEGAQRAGFGMGLWFGLAGMVRFTSGLHMLLPLAEMLVARRWKPIGAMALGALPGIGLLALVDAVTWGRPFHSAIEHFTYNYIEGKASHHGTSPWEFYLVDTIIARLGPLAPISALLVLLGGRRSWPAILTAAAPTILLSTVPHKEERFLMHSWPMWVASISMGLWQLERLMAPKTERRADDDKGDASPAAAASGLAKAAPWVTAAVALAVVGSCVYGASQMKWRWRAGLFEAQAWVGAQPDATGLLFDDRQHLNGGHLTLNKAIPQIKNSPKWWRHPLFNYAALKDDDPHVARLMRARWEVVQRFEGITVLRRMEHKKSRKNP